MMRRGDFRILSQGKAQNATGRRLLLVTGPEGRVQGGGCPDVFEKSRALGFYIMVIGPRLLFRSMQQSAPLVPPFLQVALISSLPPVFAIDTILAVTRTPLTARSSPSAPVRPRHQNSAYCWLWRRFRFRPQHCAASFTSSLTQTCSHHL
jgi:hypothetical protein